MSCSPPKPLSQLELQPPGDAFNRHFAVLCSVETSHKQYAACTGRWCRLEAWATQAVRLSPARVLFAETTRPSLSETLSSCPLAVLAYLHLAVAIQYTALSFLSDADMPIRGTLTREKYQRKTPLWRESDELVCHFVLSVAHIVGKQTPPEGLFSCRPKSVVHTKQCSFLMGRGIRENGSTTYVMARVCTTTRMVQSMKETGRTTCDMDGVSCGPMNQGDSE